MSQADILDLVKKEPGIKQEDLYIRICVHKGCISDQVRRLERWNDISRVKNGFTYKLYPAV